MHDYRRKRSFCTPTRWEASIGFARNQQVVEDETRRQLVVRIDAADLRSCHDSDVWSLPPHERPYGSLVPQIDDVTACYDWRDSILRKPAKQRRSVGTSIMG